MTKGGSFKRALRREARAAGLSYTQALALRERDRDSVDRLVGAWSRWRRLDGLADHRYSRAVAGGRQPDGSERWWPDRRATDGIAERVAGR